MSLTLNQLRDYSSLFSRGEVIKWLKNDFKSIDIKLDRYNSYNKNKGNSYLQVLRKTYKSLEKYYPNEYVLKNEFLNQWLIKELGTRNSIIFNEFRTGKAIADLAMFNGVSKAFEIKTILDKEYRLSNQIKEYKKIFNEVYIVVPNIFLNKYKNYDDNLGLITYESSTKKFELIQKPKRNYDLDIDVLMEVLHTKEYVEIVKSYYEELPKMNSFNQFEICKELISGIPKIELNNIFIDSMKKRKRNNSFFKDIYQEFNQIFLSLNFEQKDRDKLMNNLKLNTV